MTPIRHQSTLSLKEEDKEQEKRVQEHFKEYKITKMDIYRKGLLYYLGRIDKKSQ